MTASYPAAIKSFTDQTDNVSTIDAADVNEAYDEIEAIETALGINRFSTETAGSVFNEGSADYDFRFEGNGDANLLQLDAGNDRVGIGTATPSHKLDVVGTTELTGTVAITGQVTNDTNVIHATITKTGIADGVATGVFTITTTNETGSTDGGVYTCFIKAISVHAGTNAGDNAVLGGNYIFGRAQQEDGTGQLSAVVAGDVMAAAAESEGGTTRGIASATVTVTETSEYVTTVLWNVNLDGNAVTTATVVADITLIWSQYLTAPVIAAA